MALNIKAEKTERGSELSTLRPGCIYYGLIVAQEVLWRGVLSGGWVEGPRGQKRACLSIRLDQKHAALKITDGGGG